MSSISDATARFSKESNDTGVYAHGENEQDITDESNNNVNDKRLRGGALIFSGAQSNDTRIPAQNENGDRQQRESNKRSQVDVSIVGTFELVQPAKTTSGFFRGHFDVSRSFAVFASGDFPSVVLDSGKRSGK